MTATTKERNNIEEHLPHDLLKRLYLDSRVSIKQLGKDFGISHHTISKSLKESEDRYKLKYTVMVDTNKLGFSEERMVAVKFEKVPDIKLLKRILDNDPFVQNAYLGTGDFDLILDVIGLNSTEYSHWEFRFRMGFSNYKPKVKTTTLNHMIEGFFPVKSELIGRSKEINDTEKAVLMELIEDSRIKIKHLAKKVKLSQMKVIYAIKKLKERGIIKQFTTTIQNPDKRILLFYSVNAIPNQNHHPTLFLRFARKIINEEQNTNITTDYSVICDTTGCFDVIHFCNFKDGASFNERGPDFLKKAWEGEYPIIEQCVLTGLITGQWPFNTNNYENWRKYVINDETSPVKFDIYK